MRLYDYYRSSASYRVRIAIHYKKVPCEFKQIQLTENEQTSKKYAKINPQKLVPCLVDGKILINQSLSILEYLEEKFPESALLPKALDKKLAVKSFCLEIACEIHPLNNLRVLQYLKNGIKTSDSEKIKWYHHWLKEGFQVLEKSIEKTHGSFCFGDSPTWADLFLIPQIYNAHRFHLPMEEFPVLSKINEHCLKQDYFIKASPEKRLKEIENDS
ncbi:MAG: maleylacetoacetate isomerase [Lentisphaeraceae bacterium]|nr:maleylacetoacetate isomerase [Lentisphaeraceae bacterium]